MKLLPNWRAVMARAWSMRFMAISMVLSIIAGLLSLLDLFDVPPWVLISAAVLAPMADAAAMIARLMPQSNLED